MSDDASAVPPPTFSSARKGYSRDEVDAFVDATNDRIAGLEASLVDLRTRLHALGAVDEDARATEIDVVQVDVGRVLREAHQVAAEMRDRAIADTSKWRADASSEADDLRRVARRDAEHARRDAWTTGTEMLEQADEQAKKIVLAAEQDALFIRAEAERESLRLVGDGRREAEEEIRVAQAEAARLLATAKTESESIVEAARSNADAAQERTRALEQRRAELMEELNRDARLDDPDATGVRIVASSPPTARRWSDDEANVKVVSVAALEDLEPVDADDLVADVEQLRAQHDAGTSPSGNGEPQAEAGDGTEASRADEDTVVTVAPPQDPELAPPADEQDGEAPRDMTEAQPVAGATDDDAISDLFASLRARSPRDGSDDDVVPDDTARPDAGVTADEPSPNGAKHTESLVDLAADPYELRDRLLLPIENRTLRAVKRRLVDLQNRVLEELRVSHDEWAPDRAMFTSAFGDDLGQMAKEALVAGYSGAAEMVGIAQMPQPSGGRPADPTPPFITALTEAVDGALGKARETGAGARQVSAAVSKVFRGWRTDEAERRLRVAAYHAYHEGVLRSLDALEIVTVRGDARSRVCADCPASSPQVWAPADPLPDGVVLPPARPGCDCTIVPA